MLFGLVIKQGYDSGGRLCRFAPYNVRERYSIAVAVAAASTLEFDYDFILCRNFYLE
jgi:hypothetical protein